MLKETEEGLMAYALVAAWFQSALQLAAIPVRAPEVPDE